MRNKKNRKNKKQKKNIFQKLQARGIYRLIRFNSNKPLKPYEKKYFCKSRCYKSNLGKTSFTDVNFRGSIITKSSFKNSKLKRVDFLGTNLKECSFRDSNLEDVIFVNANLKNVDFKNTKFMNVLFVSTNISNCKNFPNSNPGIRIINPYPSFKLSKGLKKILVELKIKNNIRSTRVLHIPGNKFNKLNLMLLLEKFKETKLIEKLEKLKEYEKRINTSYELINILKNI